MSPKTVLQETREETVNVSEIAGAEAEAAVADEALFARPTTGHELAMKVPV